MKKMTAFAAAALILATSGLALAGNIVGQTVNYDVQAINEISVSGPVNLVVNSATAGAQPDADIDATSSYSITTNQDNKKITGVLDSAMPANVTLTANLASAATSAGDVVLTAVAQDLVTGISRLVDTKGITLTLDATVAAGVVSGSRQFTLTLTDEI